RHPRLPPPARRTRAGPRPAPGHRAGAPAAGSGSPLRPSGAADTAARCCARPRARARYVWRPSLPGAARGPGEPPRRRPSAPPLSVVPRSASLSPCFLLSRSPRGGVRFSFGWGSLLRSTYIRDGLEGYADSGDLVIHLALAKCGGRSLTIGLAGFVQDKFD